MRFSERYFERLEDNAAYILDKKRYLPIIEQLNSDPNSSHHCFEVDVYVLCQKNHKKT
ncbi:hypothetical protein PCC8801_2083 [Rippkaea orientalis PCC 8801]|uniref:Uncharacterized protein n=1 Tax=Rippkaea orientalis (strain PCC 8801 / RF-1) TaxID=41431 RepID=B7JZ38_RIPO1|nr:hypothetical protein [Rippkaea orientalis]ACK66115.1 hypothetical protein PCC8801_2083 [Rippkaea orientalis PCC 8801]